MNTSLRTYLLAQGELGGFDVLVDGLVLDEPVLNADKGQPRGVAPTAAANLPPPPTPQPKPVAVPQYDSLWKNAGNPDDFYSALQKHSIYTKSMRSLSFSAPKGIKINAAYLLLFYSPQELTADSRNVLERLFKKLGVDLGACAISFFFKCNAAVMPREKTVLKEMLCKEVELINPEKIIFFRETPGPEKTEAPVKIDGTPVTFAGKPAITLYSLLEMLPSAAGSKDKIIETWNSHLPQSGWFLPSIFQA